MFVVSGESKTALNDVAAAMLAIESGKRPEKKEVKATDIASNGTASGGSSGTASGGSSGTSGGTASGISGVGGERGCEGHVNSFTIYPNTRRGLPIEVSYQPAVGIIFCTGMHTNEFADLAEELGGVLAQLDFVSNKSFVSGTTQSVVSVTKADCKRRTDIIECNYKPPKIIHSNARRAIVVPQNLDSLPPSTGPWAGFTWYVLPAMFALGSTICNANGFNAKVASIMYDKANIIKDPAKPISMENLNSAKAPADAIAAAAHIKGQLGLCIYGRREYRADLLGCMSDAYQLSNGFRDDTKFVDWKAITTSTRLLNPVVCFMCDIPLHNRVYVISGAAINAAKCIPTPANPACGVVMCRWCFRSMADKWALKNSAARTRHPNTLQAAFKGTEYEKFLPLLGKVQVVNHEFSIEGKFVLMINKERMLAELIRGRNSLPGVLVTNLITGA